MANRWEPYGVGGWYLRTATVLVIVDLRDGAWYLTVETVRGRSIERKQIDCKDALDAQQTAVVAAQRLVAATQRELRCALVDIGRRRREDEQS